MFLELIAVIFAGFAGAGIALIIVRTSGGRLPRWLTPVAAGGCMLAAAISSEYSWYARTTGNLPGGLEIAESVTTKSWYRPWTYVAPMTERFSAVDVTNMIQNNQNEALWLANVYFYGRWRPIKEVQYMVDCERSRRADPIMGDGSAPLWRDVGPADPVVATICTRS